MQTLAKNLEYWMLDRNFNPHSLAKAAGLNPNAVRSILSGQVSDPRIDTLFNLASALKISLEELYKGDPDDDMLDIPNYLKSIALSSNSPTREPRPDTLRIPEFAVAVSAGGGAVTEDHQAPVAVWNMPKIYLEAHISVKPEALAIIRVSGDSMIPDYYPGDRILIDTSDRKPSDGDFVLIDGFGNLLVKKLQIIAGMLPPKIRVISTNKSYESYELEAEDVSINGRVIGKWQWK